MRFRRLFPLLVALSLAAVVPAGATSYVMVDDADMVAQAATVVDVRVVAVESAPGADRPATDYTVEIERLLHGSAPGTTLIVRVPGGVRPDGVGFRVYGAPRFAPGERAILFLLPRNDGTFGLLHLGLGAFHRVEAAASAPLAVRDLSDATELALPGREPDPRRHLARDFDAFASWIADRSLGVDRPADYFVAAAPEDAVRPLGAKFTLFDVAGFNLRWFDFDDGGSVRWMAHTAGQNGVPGGGFSEFQAALRAWNGDPKTPVSLQYAGQTGLRNGLETFDGQNVLLQNDPNSEITGKFTCGAGGTLAIGGPWFESSDRAQFRGETFVRVVSADIVMNDGIECLSLGARCYPAYIAGIYAHELGHTLAIAHACGDSSSPPCAGNPTLNDALMRATAHNDCRGARLSSDDLRALRRLYQPPGSGARGPAAPSGLGGELQVAEVLLSWTDESTDEIGFRIYRSTDGSPFGMIAEVGADVTVYLDDEVSPATTYEYRVAAFDQQRESRASNTVEVVVPPITPVSVGLSVASEVDAVVGEPIDFLARFTGPASFAEWSFGGDEVGFNDEPCAPVTFCRSHVFETPGPRTVRVSLVGPFGQIAEDTLQVQVADAPYPTVGESSFLQWTIFGQRGNTGTFESNVWLHNAGAFPARVDLEYLPRGAETPPPPRTLTIDPAETVFLPNVLDKVFDIAAGQGSLSIHAEQESGPDDLGPQLFAISRSFVELRNRAEGSFGLFVPEQTEGAWTPNPKTATGIIEGDGFISTLLAVNVDDEGGRVEVELFDRDGAPVGDPATYGLGPGVMRFRQTAELFPESADREGPFTARFTSPDGIDFLASSTLLEVGSEDQIFLPALEPAESPVLIVPRVVRSPGQFGVFLTTALSIRNPSNAPTDVTFELLERGRNNADPLTVSRTVPARGVLFFEDVIEELFDLDNATGALRVLWSNAEETAPRIVALTLSENPQGDRFGMAIDSLTGEAAVTGSGVAFGIEQSSLFKSQYGAVNLLAGRTDLLLTLRDANGTELGQKPVVLKARQHLEVNLATLFGDVAEQGENWSVITEVVSGGPVITYLANINTSGDVFFVPGQPRVGAIEEP